VRFFLAPADAVRWLCYGVAQLRRGRTAFAGVPR